MATVRPRRDGDRPEVWALPKGLIDRGERGAETAVREVLEETGLRAVVERKLGDVRYVYTWGGERVFKVVSFFLLHATGGDGTYVWSVDDGALPPGFALEEEREGGAVLATRLCGEAEEIGPFSFALRVASGGEEQAADFDLRVLAADTPLAMAIFDLPDAVVQVPYEEALLAVGGTPP